MKTTDSQLYTVHARLVIVEVVRLLIELGSNKDAKGKPRGTTLAHLPCVSGQKKMVRLLMELNADFNSTDIDGITPAHAASSNGHVAVLRLLRDHKTKVFDVHKCGVHLNKQDVEGRTPADWAIYEGHAQVVLA